jgi:hypothetical protein
METIHTQQCLINGGVKEKVQKDKQRSTKHTHKTKDRVPRTPPLIQGEAYNIM